MYRFIANGPSIPNDLLVARDHGGVVFFCGAGVSRQNAELPDFRCLAGVVLNKLGSAQDSPARKLLNESVNGFVATDRVFSLLDREFEVKDVREAVAEALKPIQGYKLDAHRILLDLSTTHKGIRRLVTTNFDQLFEECDSELKSFGPPHLPDPQSDDFCGIVHLHGIVDKKNRGPKDREFILSGADYGRAYLIEAWATRFIQSLMNRFKIVFVGYTADDPPVQYLLEALNLQSGNSRQLFAFQAADESGELAANWEHRGVKAIPFNSNNGYDLLWKTLEAWAQRARNVDVWYADLLSKAQSGPAALDAHARGQIARVISTREGARQIAKATTPIDASWLLAFDPKERYAGTIRINSYSGSEPMDPFERLGFDFDRPPEPVSPNILNYQRQIPNDAWDPLVRTQYDNEEAKEAVIGEVRGEAAGAITSLPPRLADIGNWVSRVAHTPVALWWAAGQPALHPHIRRNIARKMIDEPGFPENIRRGWRLLFAAWDNRLDCSVRCYEIGKQATREGWSQILVREFVGIYCPRLQVTKRIFHPLSYPYGATPDDVVTASVEYPRPHQSLHIPDEFVAYAVGQFRGNLELVISLEKEWAGNDDLYFYINYSADSWPELPEGSDDLAGLIIMFQRLMDRWAHLDPPGARSEVMHWSATDQYIFARLRIWATTRLSLCPEQAAEIFLSLPDSVFWGSFHQCDLLYALQNRWTDLPVDARSALEVRLRTGTYPWCENTCDDGAQRIASRRLDRLHWLSQQGVHFSFNVNSEIESLRKLASEWTTLRGDAAADSTVPVVRSSKSDQGSKSVADIPIPEILAHTDEADDQRTFDYQEQKIFQQLLIQRPDRALAALKYIGQKGRAPLWAWSAFLYSDTRSNDPIEAIIDIKGALISLLPGQITGIVDPVSQWMMAIADRLYSDAADVFDPLWDRMIEVLLASNNERPKRLERSWQFEALHSPTGKLVQVLLKDPSVKTVSPESGFSPHWTTRAEQLLSIPGELRCHALVMLGFQAYWLYYIDPAWTERVILPSTEDDEDEGSAIWGGILGGREPTPELFQRLKPGYMKKARDVDAQHKYGNFLAFVFIKEWLRKDSAEQSEKLNTNLELREILIHADDQLRIQFIWQLEQLLTADNCSWRNRIIPFFREVWPKQRALRNQKISIHLARLALASGDIMVSLVELIVPYLVPVHADSILLMPFLIKEGNDNSLQQYPYAVLDLLWAVLAEDSRQWPYGTKDVLGHFAQVPEISEDPRLSELKRRLER